MEVSLTRYPANTMKTEAAIQVDFAVIQKLIVRSLGKCGYLVGDSRLDVTKGFGNGWVIEFRIEVWR